MEKHVEFIYYDVPSIARLRPSEGSASGGTSILVHGANFQSSMHVALALANCASVDLLLLPRNINPSTIRKSKKQEENIGIKALLKKLPPLQGTHASLIVT